MNITLFFFGVIACLAAEGLVFFLAVITAAIINTIKKQHAENHALREIVADPARNAQN